MTINGVTRSDIMKRAWQIRWAQPYRTFGQCLSMAWREAKEALLVNWTHLPLELRYPMPVESITALKREIFMHEMMDNWGVEGLNKLHSMQAEMRQLEVMIT
jgi:hypothetical protein